MEDLGLQWEWRSNGAQTGLQHRDVEKGDHYMRWSVGREEELCEGRRDSDAE